MIDDRPADVVTLMWNNDDGTITTETTDFTTTPVTRTVRVWTDWNTDALTELTEGSVVVPDEVMM